MLYCPKCRQTYEDGSQRFCTNEGSRLLPALSSAQNLNGNKGVFTSILTNKPNSENAIPNSTANLPPVQKTNRNAFNPPPSAKLPKNDDEISLEIENKPKPDLMIGLEDELELELDKILKPQPKTISESDGEKNPQPEAKTGNGAIAQNKYENQIEVEKIPFETKTPTRLVSPLEIPSGTADVGDRSVNPPGRKAVTRETPKNLLGQIVKGRYQVAELLGEEATGLIYLAEDTATENKKVVIRVFMETNGDDLTNKILAEERIALSHINHPNVAGLIDSGELPEGNSFIVTEFVAGESVKKKLKTSGQFDARRAARIIRQAAYALSEVHQNGVLHRALKPQNIIMTVNGAGAEQIKVTDFAIADGWKSERDFAYLAPEQLDEKPAIFAGDIYSLAVIAFQMLTNRLPFSADSEEALRKEQKQGLKLKASDLRLGVPTQVDEILEKALAFNPTDRYPKARDFGDAFFNALVNPAIVAPPVKEENTEAKAETNVEANYISIKSPAAAEQAVSKTEDLLWEKRSPEPPKVGGKPVILFSVLGLALLFAGLWAIWYYFLSRPAQPGVAPVSQNEPQPNANAGETNPNTKPAQDIEIPPQERRGILQPPNTNYFENTRENLSGDLAKNYRGFSFYYPSDWMKSESPKNFVDVAKKSDRGLPVEQMLVTFYESKGTFKADSEKFPALVRETNKRLAEQLPNYNFVSESPAVINDGWKVYEMKFEASMPDGKNGAPLKIYGRRIFMPAMRDGVKTGFVITMLATSLSENVASVDEVGVKGGLKIVLDTFEPSQIY